MQPQTKIHRVDPQTREAHRKQVQQQILVPVILGSAILLALGGLAAWSGGDRSAVWAHISTIFMAVIIGLSGILSLGLLFLLMAGTHWVEKKLPEGSYLLHAYLILFSSGLKGVDDKVSSPWISIRSGWAGLRHIFRRTR